MSLEPEVQPLPYKHRTYFFRILFSVFFIVMPIFLFYAIGYRFDFNDAQNNIVSTGGLYISAGSSDVEMFVDEKPVRDIRVFRSASYIQNLNEGKHNVHVQLTGSHTWVKELPVYPHIVTEALAFNVPVVPQVRAITPYTSPSGEGVLFASSTDEFLPFASTTNALYATTSTATSSYALNPEYVFIDSLFATSATTTTSLVAYVVEGVEEAFSFSSSLPTSTSNLATTSRISGSKSLLLKDDGLFAKWEGSQSSIPYYYCIDHVSASSTAHLYGEHVLAAVQTVLATTGPTKSVLIQNDRISVCRDEIRIDTKGKQIRDFDFYPGSTDLVLLVLDDGVYVTEIDDRSWQNVQLLYPGSDLQMQVDGGRIYVLDGAQYIEVLTEIPAV